MSFTKLKKSDEFRVGGLGSPRGGTVHHRDTAPAEATEQELEPDGSPQRQRTQRATEEGKE
jgi:hypothetical protein